MNTKKFSGTLNLFLWVAQLILSLSFVWGAWLKLFETADKLAAMWPWTAGNSALVKFTGVLDLLAGIGLVLPALLRIKPKLTIYAAYGCVVLMGSAAVFHLCRNEFSQTGVNVFFALMAVFIAWGRLKQASIKNE